MSFTQEVKERALVACARHCCICHKFVGLKMELHHIKHKSEGGDDAFENAIPLCLDCHADMRSYDHKHPKGTKYSRSELLAHRDNWYAKVVSTPLAPVYDETSNKLDGEVFAKINTLLGWEDMHFIKTHNFGASFPSARIKGLGHFVYECEDPAFEFIDAELESLRANLRAVTTTFMHHIGVETFVSDRNDGWQSIPHDWEYTNRLHYFEAIKNMNEAATKVSEAYTELIRRCRVKLK